MMRRSFGKGLGACVIVTMLAAAGSVQARIAAPGTPQAGQANSRTYVDGVGDAKAGGLDIRKVTVSNDDTGRIRFSLGVPSVDKLPAKKMIRLYIDSDRNSQTGSPQGFEYEIYLYWDYSGFLAEWRGSWRKVPGHGMTADGLTIEVDRSVIGNPASFDFLVILDTYGGKEHDRAPTTALWRYQVIAPAQPLAKVDQRWQQVGTQRGSPPLAGRAFTYAAAFRSASGELISEGSATCAAAVDTGSSEARLRVKRALLDEVDGKSAFICIIHAIPVTARGAVLRVRVGARQGGREIATSTFTGRIR